MLTTSPPSGLRAAMNPSSARRLNLVARPEGEAIVVLAVGGTDISSWTLAGSARPDFGVIDALARQALTARRWGGAIRLRGAGPELVDLIRFVGLDDVLVIEPA